MAPDPDLTWAVEEVRLRAPALRRRRDYYEGRHLSALPPGQTFSRTMRALLDDLADNLCDDVVDEPVSRLSVTNWVGTSEALGQHAMDVWEQNRGPARFQQIRRDAWCQGDAYVIVQTDDDDKARFYVQVPEQMAVRYSKRYPDVLEMAARVWPDGKRWRANIYYGPDPTDEDSTGGRLVRWATKGTTSTGDLPSAKAFMPFVPTDADNSDSDAEIEEEAREWTRLPVFHYPADEIGRYGRSVLTEIIPLQDLLNKAYCDLAVAMEDVALPQRWGTGIQVEYAEDGTEKPVRRRSSAGEILRTASTEATFGQFPGADMTSHLAVIADLRAEIGRKGYLPDHSTGIGASTDVSGLNLLVKEGRQVKRVKGAQRDWGWVDREMMAYALTLEGAKCEASDLDIEWDAPETRDELGLVETLVLKQTLGVPKQQLLLELGYDEEDVADWVEEAKAEEEAMMGGRMSVPGAPLPAGSGKPVTGPQAAKPPVNATGPKAPAGPAGAAKPTASR